jgi:ribosome assembly protein 4
MLASGGMDGLVMVWDTQSGRQLAVLRGHSKWITGLAWEPYHLNVKCNRLASSSKDGTVRVWNVQLKQMEFSMAQHTDAVSCIKWGGTGLIYTASRDKSVKVWSAKEVKITLPFDCLKSLISLIIHRVNYVELCPDMHIG